MDPSQHSILFIPYTFRPYWQPNSGAFHMALLQQLENLTQQLVTAEKKMEEYVRSIGSLYVELKRYQDTACHSCRVNATHTTFPSLAVPAHFTSMAPSAQFAPTSLSSPHTSPVGQTITPILQVAAEPPLSTPSLPITPSFSTHVPATTPPPCSAGTDLEPSISETTTHPPDHTDWSVEYNPKVKQTLRIHLTNTLTFAHKVLCAKFSRDGRYLAVGLDNGETHLHDMKSGSNNISVLAARSVRVSYNEAAETPSMIWVIGFSVDNKFIATGGSREINIWQIDRKRVRATFLHTDIVRFLDFSPDGRFLVSASYDKSVCVWSLRDGSKRAVWHGSDGFTSVAFSPDRRYVAAGNYRNVLSIWDARTGHLAAECSVGTAGIASVRAIFTPDGKGIASGSETVSCWDLAPLKDTRRDSSIASQLERIFEFAGHKGYITSLSFSSDNQWIVSSSLDHSVRILDAQTGTWLCVLLAHSEHIRRAEFSPAGRYLVSAGNGLVRLWRYETEFVKSQ